MSNDSHSQFNTLTCLNSLFPSPPFPPPHPSALTTFTFTLTSRAHTHHRNNRMRAHTHHRMYSYGEYKAEDQDRMLTELDGKVATVYASCIGANEANIL